MLLGSANAAFVLGHDRTGHFRLASMQGEIGSALYRGFGIDPANSETLTVVEGDRDKAQIAAADAACPDLQDDVIWLAGGRS